MISFLPLKRTMILKNIDVETLSERIGVKPMKLKGLLDGKFKPFDFLGQICKELDCKVEDVIEWRKEEPTQEEIDTYLEPLNEEGFRSPYETTAMVNEEGEEITYTPMFIKLRIVSSYRKGVSCRTLSELYKISQSKIKTWVNMYDKL